MIKSLRRFVLRAYFKRGHRKNIRLSDNIDGGVELMRAFRTQCASKPQYCWSLASEITRSSMADGDFDRWSELAETTRRNCAAKKAFFDGKAFQLGALDLEIPVVFYSAMLAQVQDVLEIGVANGYSSAFLYRALVETGGAITSIDMPRFSDSLLCRLRDEAFAGEKHELTGTVKDIFPGGIVPTEKWGGWFVDSELRYSVRNTCFYGNMFSILPDLGKKTFDMVVFDAMKDHSQRKNAFAMIYERMTPGGICFVDGYWVNNAFAEFCTEEALKSWTFGRVGAFRKQD